jgi:hypothetical protein
MTTSWILRNAYKKLRKKLGLLDMSQIRILSSLENMKSDRASFKTVKLI